MFREEEEDYRYKPRRRRATLVKGGLLCGCKFSFSCLRTPDIEVRVGGRRYGESVLECVCVSVAPLSDGREQAREWWQ